MSSGAGVAASLIFPSTQVSGDSSQTLDGETLHRPGGDTLVLRDVCWLTVEVIQSMKSVTHCTRSDQLIDMMLCCCIEKIKVKYFVQAIDTKFRWILYQ